MPDDSQHHVRLFTGAGGPTHRVTVLPVPQVDEELEEIVQAISQERILCRIDEQIINVPLSQSVELVRLVPHVREWQWTVEVVSDIL